MLAHSITGYTDHCTSFVLLAAYGSGASELEKTPVMSGPSCSHAMLLEQPACLHFKITNAAEAAQLPPDFRALYDSGGMRSFLSIPIATDHEVIGALTIAKEDDSGFEIDWWGCLADATSPCNPSSHRMRTHVSTPLVPPVQ